MAKTKIVVDSSTYDLIGLDKPNYMSIAIVNSFFNSSPGESVVDSLKNSLLYGSWSIQKSSLIWAKKYYKEGFPGLSISLDLSNNSEFKDICKTYLETLNYTDITFINIINDVNRVDYLMKSYLYQNYPSSQYYYEYDTNSDEDNNIEVTIKSKAIPPLPDKIIDVNIYNDLNLDETKQVIVMEFTDNTTTDNQCIVYTLGSGYLPIDNYDYDKNINPLNNYSFFPIIPLRIWKKWINNGNNKKNKYRTKNESTGKNETIRVPIASNYPEIFNKANKYFIRLSGKDNKTNLNSLEAQLEHSNDKVNDIDFTFIHQGIDVNTRSKDGARYLFRFFRQFYLNSTMKSLYFQTNLFSENFQWAVSWGNITYQRIPLSSVSETARNIFNNIKYYSTNIIEFRKNGNIINDPHINSSNLFIYYKAPRSSYIEIITVSNLLYGQHVYKGRWSNTSWSDVVQNYKGDDPSEIIIPYHYDILKLMPLTVRNQLCTENLFIVFSCYKEKKIRWYQRGFFKIIVVVIGVVIGAITGTLLGLGGLVNSLAGGLIGGTVSGIAGGGLIGTILGAVANALVGVILTSIITKLTQGLGLFGTLLRIVFSLITLQLFSATNLTQFLNSINPFDIVNNFGKIFTPGNIMNVVNIGSQEVNAIQQQQIRKIQDNILQDQKRYNEQISEIRNKEEEMGFKKNFIDPQIFLSRNEYPEDFYTRTTLRIQDMVDLSLDYINSFYELNDYQRYFIP